MQNSLKEMAQTRRGKFGTFLVEFNTPGIGQIMKAAGCDFVLLDMEHSGFSFDSLKSMLRYMQSAELPTIVRVPSRNYHHIARALDMGAEGLMLPMVNSGEETAQIVAHAKYPSQGHRGVTLQIAHDRYQPGPVLKKLRDANKRTTIPHVLNGAIRSGMARGYTQVKRATHDCLLHGRRSLQISELITQTPNLEIKS